MKSNPKSLPNTLVGIMAILAIVASLPAQQPPPAPAPGQEQGAPEENSGKKVRMLSFQLDSPPAEVYAHDTAMEGKIPGTKVELKSYLNHEFSLLPPLVENIVFTTAADPASVRDATKLVAKAKLPANARTAILMFLPGGGRTGDAPFRVLAIEDSVRDFPRGSFKVMNLSPQSVRIQLEKTNYDMASGQTRVIEDPPVGPNNSSSMAAFSAAKGEVKRIASGIWPSPGQKRSLQVLFLNPVTGMVEIRGIRDVAVDEF